MKRLRDTAGNDLARTALRSARADAPSRRARERTALALGVSAAIGVTTATTSATAASLPMLAAGALGASQGASGTAAGVGTTMWGVFRGMPFVAKAVSLTLATAALATGGTMIHFASRSSMNAPMSASAGTGPSPVRPAPVAAPGLESPAMGQAPSAVPDELAKTSAVPSVNAPFEVGRPAAAPSAVIVARPTASTTRMEDALPRAVASENRAQDWSQALAVLESARTALAAGDATKALAVIDDYDRRFPNGALSPEATVLRIEALVASGADREALGLSDRFLAANPNGPHARHVRAVVASIHAASPNR